MKVSPWWLGGAGGLVVLGLVGLAFGFFQPGWPDIPEAPEGGGKSVFAEFKQKTGEFRTKLGELEEKKKGLKEELSGHRVFVSRSLVFLPKDAEPVKPLNIEQVTDDGIQVGWKLKYGFSPEDPDVSQQDEDQDGFTNLEEYEKKTDPKDPASSPSKWVKIKISSAEKKMLVVSFTGKSLGLYTLRFKLGKDGKNVEENIVVGDKLWVLVGASGLKLYKGEQADVVFEEAKKIECPHIIPLLVKQYKEDQGRRINPNTQTENDYDDSTLILERQDGLTGLAKVMINEGNISRGVAWNVGNVRLNSMVPGEGEMGPYRVGQSFTYAGKTFVVTEASPEKVSLRMSPEGDLVDILSK
jgi:hypothetical protein